MESEDEDLTQGQARIFQTLFLQESNVLLPAQELNETDEVTIGEGDGKGDGFSGSKGDCGNRMF